MILICGILGIVRLISGSRRGLPGGVLRHWATPRSFGEHMMDDLRLALESACWVQFWRSYKDDWATIRQHLNLAHDPIQCDRAQRIEAYQLADEYTKILNQRMKPFWDAWVTLGEVCRSARKNLPRPDTDPATIDPDAAAAAVDEALSLLSSQVKPDRRDDGGGELDYEVIYAYLTEEGHRVGATFVRFMAKYRTATHQEILDGVYTGEWREWESIATRVKEVNSSLACCLEPEVKPHARRLSFIISDRDMTVVKKVK